MTQATTSAATGPARASGERPVIACQELTKVFKDFWMRDRARAVDRLSMQVMPKEIFGLLGPNGSGKSTTIKMILGLLRPTSGRVVVFGKAPNDVKTKKRIGYLPEESYLYGFLNAQETLDYYGKLFKLDPRTRSRRIDELLDMVGLTHAAHRPVREYSKGMQRRIGLAQALINDPDLLILDEPTTGLDPIGTRQVKDLIIELGRRGKTVILSSHLLSDVEDVVDRMVILYGGKTRGEGTTGELLESQQRTTIETDDLDEDTLAEIDRVIRERTQGEKSVRRVSRPRQKLEELFLDIVKKAQAEKASTSGALHGGQTAEFLRSEEGDDDGAGEALIESLVSAEPESPADGELAPMAVEGESPPSDEQHTENVIDSLMGGSDQPEPESYAIDQSPAQAGDHPVPAPEQPGKEDVDLGVIGSLVDSPSDDDKDRDK
ncbi:MAG: ATP-binding cassette domain-containing protein [Planctomycetota bacterium]